MVEQWVKEPGAIMRYKTQIYESKKRKSNYAWNFKVLFEWKEITADNIHINEAETILKTNPLSLPRLKHKTRLTPQTSLKQNKNQAYINKLSPSAHFLHLL